MVRADHVENWAVLIMGNMAGACLKSDSREDSQDRLKFAPF